MKKIIFSLLFVGLIVPASASALSPVDPFVPCAPGHLFSYLTGEKCPVVPKIFDYCAYKHLTIGSTGSQVIELQTKLVNDGFLIMPYGVAKGYFGNLTAQAVANAKAKGLYDCTPISKPTIKVISPNGGEQWLPKLTQYIKWENVYTACLNISPCAALPTSDFYNRKVDIYLVSRKHPCSATPVDGRLICPTVVQNDYILDKNVDRSNNSYGWIVATDINDDPIVEGSYKVQICLAGSTTDCDYSDEYFTISSTKNDI